MKIRARSIGMLLLGLASCALGALLFAFEVRPLRATAFLVLGAFLSLGAIREMLPAWFRRALLLLLLAGAAVYLTAAARFANEEVRLLRRAIDRCDRLVERAERELKTMPALPAPTVQPLSRACAGRMPPVEPAAVVGYFDRAYDLRKRGELASFGDRDGLRAEPIPFWFPQPWFERFLWRYALELPSAWEEATKAGSTLPGSGYTRYLLAVHSTDLGSSQRRLYARVLDLSTDTAACEGFVDVPARPFNGMEQAQVFAAVCSAGGDALCKATQHFLTGR